MKYNEHWGYVDVREGAHMFWWLYAKADADANTPLILWLQVIGILVRVDTLDNCFGAVAKA